MTTGKIIAFTILTFVSKLMSLLFNAPLVIALLPKSKCVNFMAAVTVHSDFWSQENKVCHCIHSFPIYFPWSEGSDAMILLFWMLSFMLAFSLSSFTTSSRGSLVYLHLLPQGWCHLHIWGLKPLPCFITCSKTKPACYSRYLLTSYFCIPVPMMKRTFFWVLVPEGLIGIHRNVKLLQLQLSDWGIDLENWYWMVCLGNKSRSFCHFCDFNQVLHFGIFFFFFFFYY